MSVYGTSPFYSESLAQDKIHTKQGQKFLTPSIFTEQGASGAKQLALQVGKVCCGADKHVDPATSAIGNELTTFIRFSYNNQHTALWTLSIPTQRKKSKY